MIDQNNPIPVYGRDGLLGWVEPSELEAEKPDVLIHLPEGGAVITPVELLEQKADGAFLLPLSREQIGPGLSDDEINLRGETEPADETMMVIPLIREQATVEKRVAARPVRISKRVKTEIERIENAGYQEEIQVERVAINQPVDVAPEVRKEGDTTVIPLVEEVLVVEKRLILREEVRITMKRIPNEAIEVPLRAEEIEVDRSGTTEDTPV